MRLNECEETKMRQPNSGDLVATAPTPTPPTLTPMTQLMRHIAESGEQEGAFFVCDAAKIKQKVDEWRRRVPFGTPCFEVFCNSHPVVLKTLSDLGCRLLCQNKAEIQLAVDAGVARERLVFASKAPVPVASHLKAAAANELPLLVCGSQRELKKVKQVYGEARLLLVVQAPRLGGGDDAIDAASPSSSCQDLLYEAKKLDLSVVGIALKTGGDGDDELTDNDDDDDDDNDHEKKTVDYRKAMALAKLMFATGRILGHEMRCIDLGAIGGSRDDEECLEETTSLLRQLLPTLTLDDDADNGDGSDLDVFFRPGSSSGSGLVSSAISLAVQVVGKRPFRSGSDDDGSGSGQAFTYVLSEGVFGCFGRRGLDDKPVRYAPFTLFDDDDDGEQRCYESELWGPSGDDADFVADLSDGVRLAEMRVGDWLAFPDMGAYTMMPGSPGRFGAVEAPAQWNEDGESAFWILPKRPLAPVPPPASNVRKDLDPSLLRLDLNAAPLVSANIGVNLNHAMDYYSDEDLLKEMLTLTNLSEG